MGLPKVLLPTLMTLLCTISAALKNPLQNVSVISTPKIASLNVDPSTAHNFMIVVVETHVLTFLSLIWFATAVGGSLFLHPCH